MLRNSKTYDYQNTIIKFSLIGFWAQFELIGSHLPGLIDYFS
jgi:hypothetical protein